MMCRFIRLFISDIFYHRQDDSLEVKINTMRVPYNIWWHIYIYYIIQVASLASLASATFVCTLGREQQYFLNAKGQIWDQPYL